MTVHIISHTHWDREWFLNSPYTKEWLIEFFDNLFRMMEKEPGYRFVLDGQTLIIEDYVDELERRRLDSREYLERLRGYASRGQVIIGPYYLQPDWQLVSGESLIRNLCIGIRTAGEFARPLSAGWLLDNFGQISQAVQIHTRFGMKGIFLWRGMDADPLDIRTEFLWESPDGSVLPSVYLIDSYRNAMRLSENAEFFDRRIRNAVGKLTCFATTEHILLMNGYDQETRPDDILPLLRSRSAGDLRMRQSTPEEYLDAVLQARPELNIRKGHLYSGRYISVFPGVLSSRIYLKTANERCQRLIERYVEPVQSAVVMASGSTKTGHVIDLWKTLLKNHPHDNICGVSIDDVHTDMEERFFRVERESLQRLEGEVSYLVSCIDTETGGDGPVYVAFNPSFGNRNLVVAVRPGSHYDSAVDTEGHRLAVQEAGGDVLYVYLPGVSGFGYAVFSLDGGHGEMEKPAFHRVRVEEQDSTMENRFCRIRFNREGTFSVESKTGNFILDGFGVFEDTADAGDTYNYSPLGRGGGKPAVDGGVEITFTERGPLRATAEIRTMLVLPEGLNRERTGRSTKMVTLPVVTCVTLEAGSPLLRLRTLVKNTVKDHRLRILFPTRSGASVSNVQVQFDVLQHPVEPAEQDDGDIPEEVRRVMIGARETGPITTFPQQSFVYVGDDTRGCAVLNRGLPEYEVLPENRTIALTLFRSIGWLARGDLVSRTGDAGPMIRTPGAQCLREMEFRYAILPCALKDGRPAREIHTESENFRCDPLVVETGRHRGELPSRFSLWSLESGSGMVQVSALKPSEDGTGCILRCWNAGDVLDEVRFCSAFDLQEVWRSDLNEQPLKQEKVQNGKECSWIVGPKEICTVKVVPGKKGTAVHRRKADRIRIVSSALFEPAPDFSGFPGVPVVTAEDVTEEERRVASLRRELEELKRRGPDPEGRFTITARRTTLERAILETRLSLVLCKKAYIRIYPDQVLYEETPEEIDRECRDIGLALNGSRIRKRTFDYLSGLDAVQYIENRQIPDI